MSVQKNNDCHVGTIEQADKPTSAMIDPESLSDLVALVSICQSGFIRSQYDAQCRVSERAEFESKEFATRERAWSKIRLWLSRLV